MAAVFDCSVGYFARELAPTFRSAGHVKTVAGRPYFYARGCIETWAKARYGPESEAPLSDSDLWLLGQLN